MRVARAHEAILESIFPDLIGTLTLGGGLGVLLAMLAQRYSLLEQPGEALPGLRRHKRRGSCSWN